jgi:aerobic carbon-monoxide dehydrogenase large subunit
MTLGGSVLGHAVKRREDRALLTGAGSFTGDVPAEGMLHGVFVRSHVPHGMITAIDREAGRAMAGVLDIFTGDDLDLNPQIPFGVDSGFSRAPLGAHVRYVGDPVAVVVAGTEMEAADAARTVWAEIESLGAVVDPERALEAGAPLLFPEQGSNLALAESIGDEGALQGAEVVVSQRMVNQRMAPVPMEAGAILARPDGSGGLTIWLGTQDPFGARADLAQMLGLSKRAIRVIAPDVGGGFGAKGDAYVEHAVIAAVALRLGRPVRWLESRSENLVNMVHGRNQIQYASLGATRDGRITGLEVRLVADVGAYPAVAAWLPRYTLEMASSTYDIPKIRGSFQSVATNTTPCGPYRGAGRPEAIQMVERMIDLLALELGADPVEIRRRNLIKPFRSSHRTATGAVYDSGEYGLALARVLEMADHAGWIKERNRRRSANNPLAIGVGISTYVEVTVGKTPLHDFASVELLTDGGIRAKAGGSSQGQGHRTAFAQIVADRFQVPIERVEVIQGDTSEVPRGGGTYASRTVQLTGSSLFEAAGAVIDQARDVAADTLEATPDDIVVVPGVGLGVAGSPDSAIEWADLATAANALGGRTLASEMDFKQDKATYPFGAHMAVVEVDTETGWARLLAHAAVDDCGSIVNPMLFQGQQHGGIAQGAGQALWEHARFDENGYPLTPNLVTYHIPVATDLPSFLVSNTITPTQHNPLGAKGAGEAGTIGSTPAIHSAVMDALSTFGIKHLDMPLTPDKIWEAINAAR